MGARSTDVVVTLFALISAVPPRVKPTAKATAHSDFSRFGFKASVSKGLKEASYGG